MLSNSSVLGFLFVDLLKEKKKKLQEIEKNAEDFYINHSPYVYM